MDVVFLTGYWLNGNQIIPGNGGGGFQSEYETLKKQRIKLESENPVRFENARAMCGGVRVSFPFFGVSQLFPKTNPLKVMEKNNCVCQHFSVRRLCVPKTGCVCVCSLLSACGG